MSPEENTLFAKVLKKKRFFFFVVTRVRSALPLSVFSIWRRGCECETETLPQRLSPPPETVGTLAHGRRVQSVLFFLFVKIQIY